MAQFSIVDRRDSSDKNKSTSSRQKFINRNKKKIKDSIDRAISGGDGFTGIGSGNKDINIDVSDIDEPTFSNGSATDYEFVINGNEQFSKGDKIGKPKKGGGGGREGNPEGENSEEEFMFQLNRDEFLQILFEDLELPDLIKESLKNMTSTERVPDGFVTDGAPPLLDKIRTIRNSLGRRIGLSRKPLKEEIKRLEEEISQLEALDQTDSILEQIDLLKQKMQILIDKLHKIPFIDPLDLRYRSFVDVPKPTTSCVMICLMDVSASMGEHEKVIAKLFFWLLNMFLIRRYERVDIIFVRHTTEAKEVDEQEFFYSRETGGTYVQSGLELIIKIIKDRYDLNDWNIYLAQCSDGDAIEHDAKECFGILTKKLLPMVQYMVYIQIDNNDKYSYGSKGSSGQPENYLWKYYSQIKPVCANFDMKVVAEKKDIFPVFKKLFEKKGK